MILFFKKTVLKSMLILKSYQSIIDFFRHNEPLKKQPLTTSHIQIIQIILNRGTFQSYIVATNFFYKM